jgi:hypothetical protein
MVSSAHVFCTVLSLALHLCFGHSKAPRYTLYATTVTSSQHFDQRMQLVCHSVLRAVLPQLSAC